MKTIVVCVDFSELSNKAVDYAVDFARAFPSELWLVHVEQKDPDYLGFKSFNKSDRDMVASNLHDSHKHLQERAKELRTKGVLTHALQVQGPVVDTLLAESKKLDADLIVLGSHGYSRIYKALLGSVSEGVLRKSTRPVLIVPLDKTESSDADE